MIKTRTLLALLPLLTLPVGAQQTGPGNTPSRNASPAVQFGEPRLTRLAPAAPVVVRSAGCPISIAARRGGLPQALTVAAVEDAAQPVTAHGRTGIHVSLSSGVRAMTHLTVVVEFREFTEGVQPVRILPARLKERTFELDAADAHSLQRNLSVSGNVDIDSVSVRHVEFSDGTSWSPEWSTCSVRPSHILLVAAR